MTWLIPLWCVALSAQGPAIPDWEHPDVRLDQSSGLEDLYIKDYLQDDLGFTWIASHGSVQRFDGLTLEKLDLGHDTGDILYTAIAHDQKRNNLWVAGVAVLYKVDLVTYQVIDTFYAGMDIDWTGGPILSLHLDRNDRLWIGRNEGFTVLDLESEVVESATLMFENVSMTTLQFLRQIYSVLQDPSSEEILWFGTAAGLVKYDIPNQTATRFTNEQTGCSASGTIHHIYSRAVNNQIIHSNDRLSGQPIACNFLVFDLESEEYVRDIVLAPEWKSRGIFQVDEERLWLSTDQGSAVYHIASGEIETIVTSGNKNFPARIDFIDDHGNIWSTGTKSVNIYQPGTPAVLSYHYETEFPMGYHVCSDLLHDDQNVYMSVYGGDGVYALDLQNGSWSVFRPTGAVNTTELLMGTGLEYTIDDRILALSNQSLFFVDREQRNLQPVRGVGGTGEGVIDQHGILWTYNNNSLVQNHLKEGVLNSFPEETADCTNRRRAFRPRIDHFGNLWFLGICEGFVFYGAAHQEFIHSRKRTAPPQMSGYITDVVVIDSLAYLISELLHIGVIDLSAPDNNYEYINVINLNDLIPGEKWIVPTRAQADRDGNIWILSNNGLIKYYPASSTARLFQESDGVDVRDRELSVPSAEQMIFIDEVTLVYSTRKALHVVNTDLLGSAISTPRAYLSALLVNNAYYPADSIPFHQNRYRLKPGENYLTFEFSAISLEYPAKIEFAHKLSGVDQEWIISDRRNVTYSDLNRENYEFLLKARLQEEQWGPVSRAQIHIQKPWHEMLGLRFLMLFVVFSTGYMIYRARINRAIEKQRLKAQYERELAEVKMNALTAQMNPHFIFNSLNSIDYFIIKNETHRASDYLNRFARLIRLILNHSRSNYISLGDDLEALRLYIEIERLRFDEKFDYVIEVDRRIDLNNVKVPPMLFQPYVENAIWHGLMHKDDKGCIAIRVMYDPSNQFLIAKIEDNGIGRQRAAELRSKKVNQKSRKSMGMTINKDKIDLINKLHNINATIEIDDLKNGSGTPAGTRVTLSLPI